MPEKKWRIYTARAILQDGFKVWFTTCGSWPLWRVKQPFHRGHLRLSAYQTFTLWFITAEKVQVWSSHKNNFIVGVTTTWETMLNGWCFRKAGNSCVRTFSFVSSLQQMHWSIFFWATHLFPMCVVQSLILCLPFIDICSESTCRVGWGGRVGMEPKVSFSSEPVCSLFLESIVLVVDHRAIFIDLSQCPWARLKWGPLSWRKEAVIGGRRCVSNLNFVLRHLWSRCGDRRKPEKAEDTVSSLHHFSQPRLC